MELIIETLGTTHNVLDRNKFVGSDISLGRAFDNDLILTDEHIDAHHARVYRDKDGQFWISDLKSVNGIRKHKSHRRQQHWPLQSGDIFMLGRNKIRIYFSDHKLPAAVKIRPIETFLLWLGRMPVLIGLFLLYLGISLVSVWMHNSGELQWEQIANSQLRTVLIFTGLAFVVYLLSILFKRGGNFLSHLGVLMMVFVLGRVLAVITSIAYFNADSDTDQLLDIFAASTSYLMIFLYLWCIFYLAFHMPLLRRSITALISVVILAGLSYLGQAPFREFQDRSINVDNTHLPPQLLLRKPTAQDAFFDEAFELFDVADQRKDELLKRE
ncbi:MAG: FHA domain-containing protein [Gammaproteobacteria bacterium]|jgi:hypothetical protein|nr:FHA domain-containing protein [Gammaproteobacteria bacterium]